MAFAFAGVDLARSAATAGSVSTGAQPKANADIASFLISFSNLIHWPAFWRERNILSMLQVYGESCRAHRFAPIQRLSGGAGADPNP